MPQSKDIPQLGFWEWADLPFVKLSIYGTMLYAAITGAFRGKASPKKFSHHLITAAVRKYTDRTTLRQKQYIQPPTDDVYASVMRQRGLQPETVELPHNAAGHWIGNKNAKNVLVYYHGGGFVMPALPTQVGFWVDMIKALNENGHDIAVLFPRYTLAPFGSYPTQLRQSVGALRYILTETGRSPSDVMIGGDSAGGNLALAVLLHLSHPHPDIDPLELSAPLAGAFGYAPWINFSVDWPSMTENAYKDVLTTTALNAWSKAYMDGKTGDSWSEPDRAPVDWWKDVKTEHVMILVGGDELFLSPIEAFVKKVKTAFPNTTYVVGDDESHDAPFFVAAQEKEETQTGAELRKWIASRL